MNVLGKLLICSIITLFNPAQESSILKQKDSVLQVELNDAEAVSSIKKQLIYSKYGDNYEIIKAINIEASEIKIEGLDVSKTGYLDVLIHLDIASSSLKNGLLVGSPINEKVRIEIVDTTAPEIELKYDHIWLDFEEELNPLEWIASISDNDASENLTVSVDTSALDISVPKDYEIIYKATDLNGNTTEKIMIATVKEEVKPYTNYGTNDSMIIEMLNLINETRAMHGLSAYKLGNQDAQTAAGVRACEASTYISHTRPDGSHYKTALDEYGVSYKSPYEILTYAGSTVQDKFDWWMNSSGHRSYILHSSSNTIAIGYCNKMWSSIIYTD